jgi:hypothetical protein
VTLFLWGIIFGYLLALFLSAADANGITPRRAAINTFRNLLAGKGEK